MLTIALSKGKLIDSALELFRRAGYTITGLSGDSRRLIFVSRENDMTFLIVRPSDVPTYVEYGGADAGIVGKDVLKEQESDVYEPLDLGFGACRISVASLQGEGLNDRLSSKVRIATKDPRITERYFNKRGLPVEIIKLYGSIELAPVVGLADRIVDLVETGSTLKAHDLVEVEVIAKSSARFIVNRASFRLKQEPMMTLIRKLRSAVQTQAIEYGNGHPPTVSSRKKRVTRP
jgi:ATP phosphoribosyltransferase